MWRASLPMYNLPEMRAANAAFFAAVRQEAGLAELPAELEFDRKPVPAAIEPEKLFTQVCGYPLQTIYEGQAAILGVPCYDAAYCEGPTHAGVFVVGADSRFRTLADLRGSRFVFNSMHSNSGMSLPRRSLAELAAGSPFLGEVEETHSQPANIERVARGEAEATCVDCVTYAFFQRHRPALAERTRILAATVPSPAIPFVCSSATPAPLREALRAALFAVAAKPEWAAVREGLLLRDIVAGDLGDYAVQLRYEAEAKAMGYPMLA